MSFLKVVNLQNPSQSNVSITIGNTGNVGIGSMTPQVALDVVGNTSISGGAVVAGGMTINGNASIGGSLNVTGNISLSTISLVNPAVTGNVYTTGGLFANTVVLASSITSSGNITAQNSMVANNLQSNAAVQGLTFNLTGTTAIVPSLGIYSPSNNNIAFTTNTVQVAVINGSGNVGIGTVTPVTKLDIIGSGGTPFLGSTFMQQRIRGAVSNSDYSGIDFTTQLQTTPTARIAAYFASGGSYLQFGTSNNYSTGITVVAMSLDPIGNLTAAANVTAYSDLRLKEDIETIKDALALVNGMRGVTYRRRDNGTRGVGVIAQEMQAVLPEVVLDGEHLSVAYGNLVGVLIEAIKELSGRVEMLESLATKGQRDE